MVPRKYFTIDEANRMIPSLEAAFGRIIQIRGHLKSLYQRLDARGFAPSDEHFPVEVPGAPPDVLQDRATFKGLVETLREELATMQQSGCVVKDLETGLVDWFAKKDGRDILLCWRYGEKAVEWWHDLESGFAGRRPVSELASAKPPTFH